MNKKQLRIGMIIQSYYPYPLIGGAERQIAALAPLLQAKGGEITVFTRQYAGLSLEEEIDGVLVKRMPIPPPKAVASLSFTFHAIRALAQWKPDVIHAHELLSPTLTAVLAGRLLDVPVVAKLLRGGELGDLAKLNGRFGGPARMELFRREVARFIAISDEIEEELIGEGLFENGFVRIPNGVDTAHYTPLSKEGKKEVRAQFGLGEELIAVYTGRLSAEKRVDQLIRVWNQFPNGKLIIVGTGEEEDSLKKIAGENIIFTGRVGDVTPYLQAADIFVLPSATEGLSNALLEGMAAGLAVVATAVGGAPDLIHDGENGLLVPADDEDRLKDGLIRLISDESLRHQFGERARETVQARYGLPFVADQLWGLYQSVIKERKERR